jgi:hypothetical protein
LVPTMVYILVMQPTGVYFSLTLSAIGGIGIPSLIMLWRAATRSATNDANWTNVARQLAELQRTTDERLTWLERNAWPHSRSARPD